MQPTNVFTNIPSYAPYSPKLSATSGSTSSSSSTEQAESEVLMGLLCYGEAANESNISNVSTFQNEHESFFQLLNTLGESVNRHDPSNEASFGNSVEVSAENLYSRLLDEHQPKKEEARIEEVFEDTNETDQSTVILMSKVEDVTNHEEDTKGNSSSTLYISAESSNELDKNIVVDESNETSDEVSSIVDGSTVDSSTVDGSTKDVNNNNNHKNNSTVQEEKERAQASWQARMAAIKKDAPLDVKEGMGTIIQILERQGEAIEKLTERVLNMEQNFPKLFERMLETRTKGLLEELDAIFVKHSKETVLFKARSANLEALATGLQMENESLKGLLQQQSNQINWMLHTITYKPSLMMR